MRNSIADEKVKAKLSADDKNTIDKTVTETLAWLDEHQGAEQEEFAEKQKEAEGIIMPLMQKLYGSGGGGMDAGGDAGGAPAGPHIEEVD